MQNKAEENGYGFQTMVNLTKAIFTLKQSYSSKKKKKQEPPIEEKTRENNTQCIVIIV